MRRQSSHYVYVIVLPTTIICALCILGLFSPFNNIGDRQEKVCVSETWHDIYKHYTFNTGDPGSDHLADHGSYSDNSGRRNAQIVIDATTRLGKATVHILKVCTYNLFALQVYLFYMK